MQLLPGRLEVGPQLHQTFIDDHGLLVTVPGHQGLAEPVVAGDVVDTSSHEPVKPVDGIVGGAARVLAPGGSLILYGPFREDGRHTGAGNASFDASLRAENPGWGVRDLDEVAALAAAAGLGPAQVARMPSNNLAVAFVRETR